MKKLQEENEDKYKAQFSRYIKSGITAAKLETLLADVHAKIRADPTYTKKPAFSGEKKNYRKAKLTYEQRKANVAAKKKALGLEKY